MAENTDERGYTLTEAMVATMIVGIIAVGLAAVLLFSAQQLQADRPADQSAAYAQLLRETLKNYVIALGPTGTPSAQDLAALHGRNAGFMGCSAQCHKIPGDACTWAFEPGCDHDASALLPASFRAAPMSGRMSYQVTAGAGGSGARIRVTWSGAARP